jgi:uncharacterized protein
MKPKLARFFALSLAATAALLAQDTARPRQPLPLWKATDGKSASYLFGSIHAGTASLYPLPKVVEDAFAASGTLIVEVDLNRMDMQKMAAALMREGMYPAGDNLWKHVSAETRQAVEAYCEKNGLAAGAAVRMKPWMLAMTLAALPLQKLGMDPQLGLDVHFLEAAKHGKRVEQLETAEWQMALFSSLAADTQEKVLAAAVQPGKDAKAELEEVLAAWSSGDAARIDATMSKSASGPPEAWRKLREDRNPHMADAVEQCLKKGSTCFLVVGAAHLVGKEGVAAILQQRGYRVEQQFTAPVTPAAAARTPR